MGEEGGNPAEHKKSQYAARLSRARSYNQERRSTSKSLLGGAEQSGDAGLWGSLPMDGGGGGSMRSPGASSNASGFPSPAPQPSGPASLTGTPSYSAPLPAVRPLATIESREAMVSARETTVQPTLDAAPSHELLAAFDAAVGALWSWSVPRRMLAVVDTTQMLKLLDADGNVLYRVKLPGEGTTIFVGWEVHATPPSPSPPPCSLPSEAAGGRYNHLHGMGGAHNPHPHPGEGTTIFVG